jgi:methylenetetrahydrofolate dehydrogenase (NADP+)/methenyltetrahydrofolate cyclohydrolase
MAARLLDGTAVAAALRAEVRPKADAFTQREGRRPGLGIVLVGDDPASEIYVRNKLKAAEEAGFFAELIDRKSVV